MKRSYEFWHLHNYYFMYYFVCWSIILRHNLNDSQNNCFFFVTNTKLFLCVWSPCFQLSSLPHHGTISNLASLQSIAEVTRSQLNGKGMRGIREAFIIIFISTMKKQLLRFYTCRAPWRGWILPLIILTFTYFPAGIMDSETCGP